MPEPGYGLRAVFYVEFPENPLRVVLHGKRTDAEGRSDFCIGFTLGDPSYDFLFTRTQVARGQ